MGIKTLVVALRETQMSKDPLTCSINVSTPRFSCPRSRKIKVNDPAPCSPRASSSELDDTDWIATSNRWVSSRDVDRAVAGLGALVMLVPAIASKW